MPARNRKAHEIICNDKVNERSHNDNADDNQADDVTVDYCDVFLIVLLTDR